MEWKKINGTIFKNYNIVYLYRSYLLFLSWVNKTVLLFVLYITMQDPLSSSFFKKKKKNFMKNANVYPYNIS